MTFITQADSFAQGSWSQSFHYRTQFENLAPIYILIIERSRANSPGYAATTVDLDPEDNIQVEPLADQYFAYDRDGWELFTATGFAENVGIFNLDQLSGVTRAAFNTSQITSIDTFNVSRIWKAFSTQSIASIAGTFLHHPQMEFPSGHNVDLLYQEGRTQFGDVTVSAYDTDAHITRALAGFNIVGHYGTILGGYVGMPFRDFSMLYHGRVASLGFEAGVYTFKLDTNLDMKLDKELFGQVEDFSTDGVAAQTAAIGSGDTTITLVDDTGTYSTGTLQSLGDNRYVAFYFQLKNKSTGAIEYMRQVFGGAPPTYTVVRGQLGTSAIAVSGGSSNHELKYFLSFQDNPINILLKLLISTAPAQFIYQHATYDLNQNITDVNDTSLGVGLNINQIDVASFEDVRDTWFPTDIWRVDFHKRTKIKEFIEKNILKVIGCNFYINKSGQLALSCVHPPLTGETTLTLDESNTISAPQITLHTDDILNDITVKWDYEAMEDKDFQQTTRVIQATSQATYDVDRPMTLEARGVSPLYNGSGLALRYADKKTGYFNRPSPTIPLSVLMNVGALIEPGSVHYINHPKIPDFYNGTRNLTRYVWISSKRINWRDGAFEIECLPFQFTTGRVGLLGPSTLADFSAETQANKDRYMFLGDTNNRMGDGTLGYVVY